MGIALLVTACASQPDMRTPSASEPIATSSRSSPGPTATSLIRPADVEAGTLGWARVGSFPVFHPSGVLGFDAGYVVYGTIYETGAVGAFYSRDARTWSQVAMADPCGEGGHGWDLRSFGATDGRSVMVLGRECDGSWVTWATDNGEEWQRASMGASDSYDGNIWTTPTGWEALLTGDTNTIMRSGDGRQWNSSAVLDIEILGCCPKVAASRDGLRVIGDHLGTLVSSTDGMVWRDLPHPYMAPMSGGRNNASADRLSAILPADATSGTPWVLFTKRQDGQAASSWASGDLMAWGHGAIPRTGIAHVASTRLGLLATGADTCVEFDQMCSPERRAQFHSADGVTWTPLGSSVYAMGIADGPAGIIAVGLSADDSPSMTVWRLGPLAEASPPNTRYTDTELELLFRVRADLQARCEPLRSNLPRGALAAVECHPDTPLIDSVGYYQYSSGVDAAAVYLERMAENEISPVSGDCHAGRGGDHAWTPGDNAYREPTEGMIEFGGHVLVTARFGCFVNDLGFANVRVVCGSLLVGLLGNDRDLASLTDVAWASPPGTPMATPTAPGICQGP